MSWYLPVKKSRIYCLESEDKCKTKNFPEASQTLFGKAKDQMERTVHWHGTLAKQVQKERKVVFLGNVIRYWMLQKFFWECFHEKHWKFSGFPSKYLISFSFFLSFFLELYIDEVGHCDIFSVLGILKS